MKKAVKKKKTTKVVETKNEISELRKLTYIFCIIVGVFLIFYGIAYLKAQNDSNKKEEATSVIQYDGILISNIGKQKEKEYYVIAYTNVEEFANFYRTYINKYLSLENPLSFYFSDMNDSFNKKYSSGTDNLKDINNLTISGDVLFKIKDGKITNTYVGSDAIVKQLKSLCKITN